MELDFKVVLFCTQEEVDTLSQEYNVRSVTRLDDESEDSEQEVDDNEDRAADDEMEEEQGSGDEEEEEVFPYQHRANVPGHKRCEECWSQPCITNEDLNHQK